MKHTRACVRVAYDQRDLVQQDLTSALKEEDVVVLGHGGR